MIHSKQSRHTNAFILLFLKELSTAYGAQIFSHFQSELPFCLSDSASVYRALQEMEEKEWVISHWETTQTGSPRKWYSITTQGVEALRQYAEDILQRQANLSFFLTRFAALNQADV